MLLCALDTVCSLLFNGVALLLPVIFQLLVVIKLGLFDSLLDFVFELSLDHHKLLDFTVCFV